MYDLVGNPEDRFSHNEARMIPISFSIRNFKSSRAVSVAAQAGSYLVGNPERQMFKILIML